MTASELNRLLLFCGHSDVTDFLNGSPLNRYFYKQFLGLMPQHQIEESMLSLFNEIYYQVVRISYDVSPGVDIETRYLRDTELQLKSLPATQLVYSVVWVLLSLKPAHLFNEECFLAQIAPYIKNSDFKGFAARSIEDIKAQGIAVPDRFPALTCPVEALPTIYKKEERDRDVPNLVKVFLNSDDIEAEHRNWKAYSEAWITVTGGFSHAAIEKLVNLYDTVADQLKLVKMIQNACPREEVVNQCHFFEELTSRIRSGCFKPKVSENEVSVIKQNNELKVDVPNTATPLSININIPTAQQVNINPQRVINRAAESDERTINE